MQIQKIDNLPVFEITDINFENYFNKEDLEPFWNKFFQNSTDDKSYRMRAPLIDSNLDFSKKLFEEINEKIKPIILNSHFEWWPKDYVDSYSFEINDNVGTGVYLDSPHFHMGNHIDNGLSFGTCILNLEDNDGAHTVYYNMNEEEIYRGPSKRGTGILHINQPTLLHTGINESEKERYFLMTYYKVI